MPRICPPSVVPASTPANLQYDVDLHSTDWMHVPPFATVPLTAALQLSLAVLNSDPEMVGQESVARPARQEVAAVLFSWRLPRPITPGRLISVLLPSQKL